MYIIIPVQLLQTCVLEPDDGHIGLKHVVRKNTTNCECVKVTDINNEICMLCRNSRNIQDIAIVTINNSRAHTPNIR
jgi:hypothetical protein